MVSSPILPSKKHDDEQYHIVIFPFLSHGHTLPLLDLAKVLSNQQLKVTIITTKQNAPQILHYTSNHKNIHIKLLPFPTLEGLPSPCENTSHLPSMDYLPQFFEGVSQLENPFGEVLQEMRDTGSLPICVISDFFLSWTLNTCHKFNVPRIVFHGMGVFAMTLSKYIMENAEQLIATPDSEPLPLPDLNQSFPIYKHDLAEAFKFKNHPDHVKKFFNEVEETDRKSWGVIVNSFDALEKKHVQNFKQFYEDRAGAWCVGPLLLYDKMNVNDESNEHIKWLDEQKIGSVLYVAFGTQALVLDEQLNEIILGLEMSNQPFIFVIRSKTWNPPEGLKDRLMGKGLVIQSWLNQKKILSHPGIGGFLSHCGWNSVLESLSFGVPLLVWPMMAEQYLNAKIVVEEYEAGLFVHKEINKKEMGVVGSNEISKGVKELMESKQGEKVREKAKSIGRSAKLAVEKDGSSFKSVNKFIECLIAHHQHKY